MQTKQSYLDLVGKNIAGINCDTIYQLKDILVIEDVNKNTRVIQINSLPDNFELYKINGEKIDKVQVTENGLMFLFHTKSKQYLINDQNLIVENSETWEDSFFDVLSNSFYRQDKQGYWYDIEGFKMQEKFFLKGDILTSLLTKKTKQSLSFKNQDIFISKHKQLIQVGKVVFWRKDYWSWLGECKIQ